MQTRVNPTSGCGAPCRAIKSFLVDRGEGIGVGCADLDPKKFGNPNRSPEGFGYAMPGGETRDLTSGCGINVYDGSLGGERGYTREE